MINIINPHKNLNSRQIDRNNNVPYNKLGINNQPVKDEFVNFGITRHTFVHKRENMNNEDIETLKSSEELKNSLVAFLGEYIPDYLSGNMPEDEFKQKTSFDSKKARLYFAFFPKEVQERNRELFKNELKLSNSVMQALESKLSGAELRESIGKSVSEYALMKHKE